MRRAAKQRRYYYHGGVRGLRRGDRLLPPSVTHTTRTLLKYVDVAVESGEVDRADVTQRADRVYLTSDVNIAREYASLYPWGGGAVYQVIADGQVEADPDCRMPGLSWCAASAMIVGVVYKHVPFSGRAGSRGGR